MSAVEQYAANFNKQEEVLEGCIGSMKKVSVKLYESQKYYWDISQEIGRSSNKILGFIEGESRKSGMAAALESLSAIQKSVDRHIETGAAIPGPTSKGYGSGYGRPRALLRINRSWRPWPASWRGTKRKNR